MTDNYYHQAESDFLKYYDALAAQDHPRRVFRRIEKDQYAYVMAVAKTVKRMKVAAPNQQRQNRIKRSIENIARRWSSKLVKNQKTLMDPPIRVVYWKDFAREFLAILESKTKGTGILLLIIFVIAAVGVINTTLLAAFERIREIGMMRALGMTGGQVMLVFIIESGGIGFLGGSIGVALGFLSVILTRTIGIDYTSMMKEMGNAGFRNDMVFRAAIIPGTYIAGFFLSVISTMIVSVWPSRQAAQMNISRSLCHH